VAIEFQLSYAQRTGASFYLTILSPKHGVRASSSVRWPPMGSTAIHSNTNPNVDMEMGVAQMVLCLLVEKGAYEADHGVIFLYRLWVLGAEEKWTQ
jgi:hypothetical protein